MKIPNGFRSKVSRKSKIMAMANSPEKFFIFLWKIWLPPAARRTSPSSEPARRKEYSSPVQWPRWSGGKPRSPWRDSPGSSQDPCVWCAPCSLLLRSLLYNRGWSAYVKFTLHRDMAEAENDQDYASVL